MISWNINTACNYRCSYCTQRFKEDRGRWSRETPRFLEAFARLEGRWEVKLSGGEPFVHPTLNEIVEGLAGLGHRISVVTNFSASESKLRDFLQAARGRVAVFSCSLHLDYAEPEPFLSRVLWLQEELLRRADPTLPRPGLCVTSVATRQRLPELPDLARRYREAGVPFKVQPEKQNRDLIAYEPHEQDALRQLGGHNLTGELAFDFYARPCWAGSRYFILDDRGEAFRCYPARRYRVERLGNFLDPSFRLADGPSACLYRYCNCTVPIERGMMPRWEKHLP
ncbi:MAG: radical SAM protein [Candidatus Eremiobacterota bacterium]